MEVSGRRELYLPSEWRSVAEGNFIHLVKLRGSRKFTRPAGQRQGGLHPPIHPTAPPVLIAPPPRPVRLKDGGGCERADKKQRQQLLYYSNIERVGRRRSNLGDSFVVLWAAVQTSIVCLPMESLCSFKTKNYVTKLYSVQCPWMRCNVHGITSEGHVMHEANS